MGRRLCWAGDRPWPGSLDLRGQRRPMQGPHHERAQPTACAFAGLRGPCGGLNHSLTQTFRAPGDISPAGRQQRCGTRPVRRLAGLPSSAWDSRAWGDRRPWDARGSPQPAEVGQGGPPSRRKRRGTEPRSTPSGGLGAAPQHSQTRGAQVFRAPYMRGPGASPARGARPCPPRLQSGSTRGARLPVAVTRSPSARSPLWDAPSRAPGLRMGDHVQGACGYGALGRAGRGRDPVPSRPASVSLRPQAQFPCLGNGSRAPRVPAPRRGAQVGFSRLPRHHAASRPPPRTHHPQAEVLGAGRGRGRGAAPAGRQREQQQQPERGARRGWRAGSPGGAAPHVAVRAASAGWRGSPRPPASSGPHSAPRPLRAPRSAPPD